jgi:S1-C subfamily serine protease
MIQFACPKCQAVLSATEQQAGIKVACPKCSQRLQVPQPEYNKTVLGQLLPGTAQAFQQAPAAGAAVANRPGQALAGQPAGIKPATPPAIAPSPARANQPSVSAKDSPEIKVAEWFYTQAGKQCGPVNWPALRYMTGCGQVQPNELVWTQGMPNWAPASTVQGLFTAPGSPAVPRLRRPHARGSSKKLLWISLIGGLAACAAAVVVVVLLLGGKSKGDSGTHNNNEGEQSLRELTTKEIVAKTAKSIGHIKAGFFSGTGFLVKPNVMVSNAHVVEWATVGQIKVTFPSSDDSKKVYTPDQMLFFDRKRDLAIFSLQCPHAPLEVARNHVFQSGDNVTMIGNPGTSITDEGSLENAVSAGKLSSKAKVKGEEYYQLDIQINGGNSGGPVFDSRGQVIGVATLVDPLKRGFGFCIPVLDVINGIEKATTQSADLSAKFTSRYNARVAFLRTAKAGLVCAVGMDKIVAKWNSIITTFRRAATIEELQKERNLWLDWLRDRNLSFVLATKDLADIVPKVCVDNLLPADTQKKVADLWTSFTTLNYEFYNPGGNLTDYSNKLKNAMAKFDELVTSLRVTLGVSQDELKL